MKRSSIGALLGAAMLFGSATASATVFTYDITGVVTDDVNDFYGYMGATLPLGQAFSLKFFVDDSVPQAFYDYGATSSSAMGGGGIQDGSLTPVNATFQTGGYSYALRLGEFFQPYYYDPVTGDANGIQIVEHNRGTVEKTAGTLRIVAGYERTESCCGTFFGYSNSSSDTFDLTLKSSDLLSADYRELGIFDLDPTSIGYFLTGYLSFDRQGTYTGFDSAGLLATRLTVTSDATAIPEPATAGLFAIGLVGALAGRRRRRSWC